MSISYHLDQLPSNVLSLSGYDFFQFIRTTLGEPEAKLLNKISVKTTSSLLLIEDPLDIFNQDIDDEELDTLKEQLCFKMKNDKFLIKPGVTYGFVSLKQALKENLNQQLKHSTKRKQQKQNVNTSSISSLSTPIQEVTTSSLSLSEHKSHVLNLIKKWCNENKESLSLDSFQLEEGIDFTLNIDFEQNSVAQATIKCKCGKVISLCKNNQKIQVSNFYKHLQTIGCSRMQEIKKAQKQIILQQQLQSTISVSQFPASQSCVSPMQIRTDEAINTSAAPNINLVPTSQSKNNAKRRIVSEPERSFSTKRSRT
ncbi:unnamed protein product [Rotaria magnacalcarata]|uniref:Uncharacterized protein n=5 Tax=Rotaria magnacalcarata TaxID=392030 RepID=A0A819VGI7_9BILA|nr:unnamed protein product [Rotaria magnacalcarata]CAF2034402.1 unnamed protein product [Rotaria magnacalcarata]CAF2146014.1 unnamed protein product [Rotaria magnacalcarata]CAF4108863.1 unnamed protein product [Rotaria magnacalcarata]CAF4261542.1 unnamed protein product [Rotaria magnacalcarata]